MKRRDAATGGATFGFNGNQKRPSGRGARSNGNHQKMRAGTEVPA